jgi:hypothetical protein
MYRTFIRFTLVWTILLSVLASCKDETAENAIEPVSAVRLISDNERIIATWRNPKSTILDYVEVTYEDENGQQKVVKCTQFIGDPASGVSTAVLNIEMTDQTEREYMLVACSNSGIRSTPVKVSIAAKGSLYDRLLESIAVTSGVDTVWVNWENSEELKLFSLSINYISASGTDTTITCPATQKGDYITNIPKRVPVTFSVWTHTADRESAKTTQQATAFSKSDLIRIPASEITVITAPAEWSGCVATRMFDGDFTTFFHSSASPTLPYPHIFVIELSREYLVNYYAFYPRLSDRNALPHTTHRVLINATENVEIVEGVANSWLNTGIRTFLAPVAEYADAWSNGRQELPWFEYPISAMPKAKFIRLEILTSSTVYSQLSEWAIYGIPAN